MDLGKLAFLGAVGALVHAIAGEAPAWAEEPPGPDAVYLRDNNVIRGTLQEVVVGDHATVLLKNGQIARIVWSYVARIDREGASPAVVVTPPIRAVPPPVAVPSGESAIVRIEGPDVSLQRLEGSSWVHVCNSPCNKSVPLDATYQIVGIGLHASRGFQVKGGAGDHVLLDVSPAWDSAHTAGIVFAAVGGAAVTASPFVASANHHGHNDTAALVTLGLGAATALVGLCLYMTNQHTGVAQKVETREAPSTPRADAWKRVAIWQDSERPRTPSPAQGVPWMAPLLQGSF